MTAAGVGRGEAVLFPGHRGGGPPIRGELPHDA